MILLSRTESFISPLSKLFMLSQYSFRKSIKFSRKFTKFGKLAGRIEPNFIHVCGFQDDTREYLGIFQFLDIFYGALSKSKSLCFSLFWTNFQISDNHKMEKKNISKIPVYRSCITLKLTNEKNWIDLIGSSHQHFSDMISTFLKFDFFFKGRFFQYFVIYLHVSACKKKLKILERHTTLF